MSLHDRLLPPRLGADYRRLFWASAISNLGDGLLLAAGPLLVASITRDPLAVAGVAVALQAPWLLLSLPAGAIVDRVDRVRLFVVVNLVRVIAMAILSGAAATDRVTVPLLIVLMFALGCAEVFSDTTASTLTPLVVPEPADYGLANSRQLATFMLCNELIGPAVAAGAFALAATLPFSATTICWLLGLLLVARIRLPVDPDPVEQKPLLHEITEGVKWLWAHPPVRTLAVLIAGFNITYGAALGVLVLLAHDRLNLSDAQYGLFLASLALGGLVGAWAYPRLEVRFSLATLMRVGLILETFTHLAFALLTNGLAASAVMFVFGVHASIWGTTSTTIKQRAVPRRLYGRINGVYLLCVFGSLVIGQALGGWIARGWGITAPYWFAFFGSVLLTVVLWRQMGHVAHAGEVAVDND